MIVFARARVASFGLAGLSRLVDESVRRELGIEGGQKIKVSFELEGEGVAGLVVRVEVPEKAISAETQPGMKRGISVREFARRTGQSEKVVRVAIEHGRLKPFQDGSLAPADADGDWHEGRGSEVDR